MAGLLGPAEDHPNLLFRVGLLAPRGRRDADEAGEVVGRAVEDDDARDEDVVEDLHQRCDEKRHALGLLDGERLRGELAEHHVEERDEAEAECEGDEVNRPGREQFPEDGFDEGRDCGLTDPAQSQGGERNAELADRQIAVEVLEGVLNDPGAGFPLLDEGVHPRGANLHERELRGHEHAVHHDEEEGEQQAAEREQIDHIHRLSGR